MLNFVTIMDINVTDNLAAADRIILDTGPAGDKESLFDRGEILKGVVEEIKPDGIISLLINGRLVDAASEVDVKPGQLLYLLVDSFKNSLTYLKVISEQGTVPLDDNNLSANLRSIGLPSNADAILIANKLLQHDLPVNQQNIAFIFDALNMIGGITTRNLDIAAFILQHNIPLDKNILPLIDHFISSDGDLSRLVRDLVQILTRIEAAIIRSDSLPSTTPAVVITAGSPGTANAAGAEVVATHNASSGAAVNSGNTAAFINATTVITQGADSQNNARIFIETAASHVETAASQTGSTGTNQVAAIPSDIAVPGTETTSGGHDNTVNNTLAAPSQSLIISGETASAATNIPAAVSGSVAPGDVVLSNTDSASAPSALAAKPMPITGAVYQPPVDLDPAASDPAAAKVEFVKILRAVLDSTVSRLTGSGHGVNAVLQSMVRDRALLLDNLRLLLDMIKANDALGKTPEGQELLSKIGDLQQQLTGQALFNSAVKLGQDVFNNNFYFSFPVEIDNELSYCQLRIQKNATSRLEHEDNIKLVVSLDTPALGIVMFHIDWHRQGYIQLRGVMETTETVGFIEKNIGELLHSLGELGYSVNNLGIKVASEPGEITLKPQVKETVRDSISPFEIDVIA